MDKRNIDKYIASNNLKNRKKLNDGGIPDFIDSNMGLLNQRGNLNISNLSNLIDEGSK